MTCTGNDAYAAHVRGSKHQKVVKLHQKLGKPIPQADPNFKKVAKVAFVPAGAGEAAATAAAGETPAPAAASQAMQVDAVESNVQSTDAQEQDIVDDDVKPVGNEYIEEIRGEDGKMIKFNCKLCECGFNDPNAKEMHMKGRRHRLQYKRKVQPDLVVDIKPTPRQKRIAEAKAQRVASQQDFWARRNDDTNDDPMYWNEGRRFEHEYDMPYNTPWNHRPPFPPHVSRPGPFVRAPMPPFFGMGPPRGRPESFDDRHVIARHAEIYPKEDELQGIQRIVSHTERALKFVSDALTDKVIASNVAANGGNKAEATTKTEESVAESVEASDDTNGAAAAADDSITTTTEKATKSKPKEDGRDNHMFSFQKDTEGSVRLLKGVMRVGLLAKGKFSIADRMFVP